MELESKYILKIKVIKNNSFISVSHFNGKLILYTSIKRKKEKDVNIKLIGRLVSMFKNLFDLKLKINFILLFIQNIELNLIQKVLNFFKTLEIPIIYLKYEIPISHNGCRKPHLPRKRNKGKKKNTKFRMGL